VKIQAVAYRKHGVFHKKYQTFDAVLESNSCFCKDYLEHTSIRVLCGGDADILVLNLVVNTEATRL
jgi:hypothetical protein